MGDIWNGQYSDIDIHRKRGTAIGIARECGSGLKRRVAAVFKLGEYVSLALRGSIG